MGKIINGNCVEELKKLEANSVHCCVTSPPYFGLRDYGTARWEGGDPSCDHSPEKRGGRFATKVSGKQKSNCGSGTASQRNCRCGAVRVDSQIGLEESPEKYVENIVGVFREVKRVLRDDGTLWLNLGDSYASNQAACDRVSGYSDKQKTNAGKFGGAQRVPEGLKAKDLIGIPWRVAFALQADGWYLRQDIIWYKRNPMPESIVDRCTKAHEYIFLLSKSPRYFYDAEAIKEPNADPGRTNYRPGKEAYTEGNVHDDSGRKRRNEGFQAYAEGAACNGRNKRSVWDVTTKPFRGAHFATFPPDLIEPMIKAGTSEYGCCPECGAPYFRISSRNAPAKNVEPTEIDRFGNGSAGVHRKVGGQYQKWMDEHPLITVGWDKKCEHKKINPVPCVVLDPFFGSGTVGLVSKNLNREFIGIELNPEYIKIAEDRINNPTKKIKTKLPENTGQKSIEF